MENEFWGVLGEIPDLQLDLSIEFPNNELRSL